MLVLSLLVGAGAGLGAVAFRYMILGVTYAFTGERGYSAAGAGGSDPRTGLTRFYLEVTTWR